MQKQRNPYSLFTDSQLVELAMTNDERAYSELWKKFRVMVFHTIYKMVQNQEDADDLTLETISKAFRNLKNYSNEHPFGAWLHRIAVNQAIDHTRKNKQQTSPIEDWLMDKTDDGSDDDNATAAQLDDFGSRSPEDDIVRNERNKSVRAALREMNYTYRLILELRYNEGLPYQDIAEILEVPLGTVKAQIHRAHQDLSLRLKKMSAAA